MKVDKTSDKGRRLVQVPSFRFDLALAVDLVEEVARIADYQTIPARLPILASTKSAPTEDKLALTELRYRLINRAYHEAITYSFVDLELEHLLTPKRVSAHTSQVSRERMFSLLRANAPFGQVYYQCSYTIININNRRPGVSQGSPKGAKQ